jgi:hypothetical protein
VSLQLLLRLAVLSYILLLLENNNVNQNRILTGFKCIVTFTSGDLTPVGRGMPRAPVPFFGCGGTPHGRGSSAE